MEPPKIYSCLWFNGFAHEAAEFYCQVIPHSKILQKNDFMVLFQLNRHTYMAMNGGPEHTLSPAFSIVVNCETQQEIDEYWEKLCEGGEPGRCGWLTDKFGVSWQIIPSILNELMSDQVKAPKVVDAFMKMNKFIISDLLNTK